MALMPETIASALRVANGFRSITKGGLPGPLRGACGAALPGSILRVFWHRPNPLGSGRSCSCGASALESLRN